MDVNIHRGIYLVCLWFKQKTPRNPPFRGLIDYFRSAKMLKVYIRY